MEAKYFARIMYAIATVIITIVVSIAIYQAHAVTATPESALFNGDTVTVVKYFTEMLKETQKACECR